MACEVCERLKKSLVYEDDLVVAYLEDKSFAEGHLVVVPKLHAPIIETVPDEIVAHAFRVANKLSSITFESLGAMGTNIIVYNGTPAGQTEPHLKIHVVPRYEDDTLSFEWTPIKLDDAQSTDMLTKFNQEDEPQLDDSENYLVKSLTRIP